MHPVTLCNQALVKIGAEPIQSFEQDSLEASVAATLYPTVKNRLLGVARWSFATRVANLAAQQHADFDEEQQSRWVYYSLPAGFLRPISLNDFNDTPLRHYRVMGSTLEVTAPYTIDLTQTTALSRVRLWYVSSVEESAMPSYFQHIMVCALAAEFAIPVNGSVSLSQQFEQHTILAINDAKRLENHHDTRVKRLPSRGTLLQARAS